MAEKDIDKLIENGTKAFKEHIDTVQKQLTDKDGLLEGKLDKTAADVLAVIEQATKLAAQEKANADKIAELEAAVARGETKGGKGDDKEAVLKKHRAEAMETFIRKGAMKGVAGGDVRLADFFDAYAEAKGMPELESKAMRVGSDIDGGFLVLPEFGGVVTTQIYETSPIRLFASTVTINTDQYEFVDDYSQADVGWVAETASRPETNTPVLAKRIIPTHEIYANPRATQKMLEDGIVNVESWLTGKVSDRIARTENTAFIAGDGVGKPRGITTYAAGSSTYTIGQIEQVNSGANGGYTYDGLINLIGALKYDYLQNSVVFTNRASVTALLKIKDLEGRPIFNMTYDKNTRTLGSVLGLPLTVFNDMPTIATGSLSLGVGDLAKAYQIVDRRGITVLRDPYTAKPYVQFYTTKRVGGDVVNFEAVKLAKLST